MTFHEGREGSSRIRNSHTIELKGHRIQRRLPMSIVRIHSVDGLRFCSSLSVQRKCPHAGDADIEPVRAAIATRTKSGGEWGSGDEGWVQRDTTLVVAAPKLRRRKQTGSQRTLVHSERKGELDMVSPESLYCPA
jgi:hypothetical protein